MLPNPLSIPSRTAGEWSFQSPQEYANPFTDITLDAIFVDPQGKEWRMPGFFDGNRTWKVRFNPGLAGKWSYHTLTVPEDPELTRSGSFQVTPAQIRGFLKSVPGKGWGFDYESGEPACLLGDTTYNLFGAAFCGLDTDAFLERRVRQGFNLLRVRLPVSPFHPPHGYSNWQTRRTWPWGGSEQAPRFDQFNLKYFQTVDQVVQKAEGLEIGLEMIMDPSTN